MPGAVAGPAAAGDGQVAADGTPVLGAKLVSVFPGNRASGAPVVQAAVVLFDGTNGRPLALIEGTTLTALRTGAATGVATDLLALRDAGIVVLFGAGVQAKTQLEAVCAVRPVTQVRVVGRTPGRAEAFAAWAREEAWLGGATLLVLADPELAVRGAEIIVTATTSPMPVFPGRAVAAGAHVNAIGAFQPTTREVDSELVTRAAVFVDSRTAALEEAGDLLIPISEGRLSAGDIRAEIGEVAAGHAGRRSLDEVTLFKSVGNAVQDLAVAALAVRRGRASNRGMNIALSAEGA
jgi:ornithine cyclodeaminase